MRVCIVAREKPYIDYFAPPAPQRTTEGAASRGWREAELLDFPAIPDNPSRFDAFVLPCEDFLSLGEKYPPRPAIAYGMVELALPCLVRGASDFMREGWTIPELWARLWRLMRPEMRGERGTLKVAGGAAELSAEGEPRGRTELTGGQEKILTLLLRASPGAVPAGVLALAAGIEEADGCALAMSVSRLRGRLDALSPGLGGRIKASRGRGYAFLP